MHVCTFASLYACCSIRLVVLDFWAISHWVFHSELRASVDERQRTPHSDNEHLTRCRSSLPLLPLRGSWGLLVLFFSFFWLVLLFAIYTTTELDAVCVAECRVTVVSTFFLFCRRQRKTISLLTK